jgi:hypothetical protein
MFLKLVLSHLLKKISQDGLFQRQGELLLRSQKLIGTRLMILAQLLVLNNIQKIEQDNNAILDQAIENKRKDLAHSKIRCKVGLV